MLLNGKTNDFRQGLLLPCVHGTVRLLAFSCHTTPRTTIKNVKVHYAQGMGLLAQLCDDITMDGFWCMFERRKNDSRYFTTQADATHFSQCKGKIISVNGLYEGMMDDAINVHGTYLKVLQQIDAHTLKARYMHDQSWGFDWGISRRQRTVHPFTNHGTAGWKELYRMHYSLR